MKPLARASAPAKLFLCGEYAILGGGSAIGMAVEPRALVDIYRRPQAPNFVAAPGFADAGAEFSLTGDQRILFSPAAAARDFELLKAVAGVAGLRQAIERLQPLHLVLDTREFRHGAHKRGLGSSAALTVALAGAISAAARREYSRDEALAAHDALQAGKGSGADVALSCAGGVCALSRRDDRLVAKPLPWPRGLRMAVIDTGQAASTREMIRRFDAWLASDKNAAAHYEALVAASNAAAATWRAGSAVQTLAAIAAFSRELLRIDTASDIGIYSDDHSRLDELATAASVVYKPSGAGGGDFGLAFSTDASALEHYVTTATRAGFAQFDLVRSAQGLMAVAC